MVAMSGRDPARTQDYRIPRGRDGMPSRPSDADAPPPQNTRRGVGYDERRPPPAALPKRAKKIDAALVLCLATNDGLFRATLARVLVRAGCDVSIIHAASDVAALRESPDVGILDFDGDDAPTVFGAFHEACPGMPVLALTSDPEKVGRALKLMRLCPFEVLERSSPSADVLEAVKRLRG